jgi:UrcA family protein
MAIIGKLLTGAAVSVISLACVGAYADSPPVETHSSTVHFRDLNLNRPQDVAKLYTRITVAADRVCGPRSLTGSNYKTADYESCYGDAVAQAVAHIDRAPVTSYYRQRWAEPISPKATIAQQ